jgi:hypothetical protein
VSAQNIKGKKKMALLATKGKNKDMASEEEKNGARMQTQVN